MIYSKATGRCSRERQGLGCSVLPLRSCQTGELGRAWQAGGTAPAKAPEVSTSRVHSKNRTDAGGAGARRGTEKGAHSDTACGERAFIPVPSLSDLSQNAADALGCEAITARLHSRLRGHLCQGVDLLTCPAGLERFGCDVKESSLCHTWSIEVGDEAIGQSRTETRKRAKVPVAPGYFIPLLLKQD